MQRTPPCFVHLGRFGDLMILLPGLKALHDFTGEKPVCMVSEEFASIFEGVSYVEPWIVPFHWWRDVGKARRLAAQKYGEAVRCPKWWDDLTAKEPFKLDGRPTVLLTIHGNKHRIPEGAWDSYQLSQWRYAGFSPQQMLDWPLVFDRRHEGREAALRHWCFKTEKPKLLVNFNETGSSPFKEGRRFLPMLQSFGFEVIDLSRYRAQRIYDLLGLYDHAAGLVTSDTATLHLAGASRVPFIAFVNNGGAGSIPKGNCVLTVRYGDVLARSGEAFQVLKSWRNDKLSHTAPPQ